MEENSFKNSKKKLRGKEKKSDDDELFNSLEEFSSLNIKTPKKIHITYKKS